MNYEKQLSKDAQFTLELLSTNSSSVNAVQLSQLMRKLRNLISRKKDIEIFVVVKK